jgi:acetyltransferase-like isoleucine patch superfamily enzyme
MARIVFFFATVAVAPVLLWQRVMGKLFGADSTLEGCGQLLAAVPGRIGVALRAAFYHRVLEHCEPSVSISYGTLISKVGTRLGANVYLGPYCLLGLVTIERDTLVGPAVQIPSGNRIHLFEDLDVPIRCQGGVVQRVIIGRDCWIGGGSIIMADISDQVVVGAGSIVTKPLEPRVVAVGAPARVLKYRVGTVNETGVLGH